MSGQDTAVETMVEIAMESWADGGRDALLTLREAMEAAGDGGRVIFTIDSALSFIDAVIGLVEEKRPSSGNDGGAA